MENLRLIGINTEKQKSGQEKVTIDTNDGSIECISHISDGNWGLIWLCGALGGFDGPSFGIFKILATKMVKDGFNSLRLHYRYPGAFEECVQDVIIGIEYFNKRGIAKIALVGHSFGGAVAIQAGTMSKNVKAVIGLASQTYGAQQVAKLTPRPLLLIHGERDRNLSADCSRYIYLWAEEPKELHILRNNGHFLREAHEELLKWLRDWLIDKCGKKR